MTTAEAAKFNMIEQQIRPWEVLDSRVLSTLNLIDRADFVPPIYRGLAYADCQIPLGGGAAMLPPTIEGRMLQSLLIEDDDHVLEVGTGSGFVSACLASLAGQVHSIDLDPAIIEFARGNLARYKLDNLVIEQANAFELDRPGTYDAIAVGASLAELPQNLKLALKIGGRMFIVIGHSPVMQALLISRASENEWITRSLFETDLPRLSRPVGN